MKRKYGTISLPAPLIKKIKKKTEGTGFTSVSSFVEYLVRAFVEESEINTADKAKENIMKRLKALGYL
jgi:Arc/MetJ-type ribon-helix-helix transcriptional regulator